MTLIKSLNEIISREPPSTKPFVSCPHQDLILSLPMSNMKDANHSSSLIPFLNLFFILSGYFQPFFSFLRNGFPNFQ